MKRILTFSAALLILTPAAAQAQSSGDVRAAKKLVGDGKDLYKSGDFAGAAEAYKAAYELSKRPELLFNIGQSYRLAGKLREAEAYLQQYLAEAPRAANADQVVNAIVEIQQQIAADLVTVQAQTVVPGRAVFVDQETTPRCVTPCSVTVSPGSHVFTVRGEGVTDHVEEILLEPGKTVELAVRLLPAVERGRLVVSIDRTTGVLVVGDVRESLPLTAPMELEAGDYEVAVESARNARWSGRVSVKPNETTNVFVPMESLVAARKRAGLRRSAAYGLGGVSVASAVGGVLLGLQARETFRQLEADVVADRSSDARLIQQGRTQQVGANVMFATASVAVVAGVVLFLWDELGGDSRPKSR